MKDRRIFRALGARLERRGKPIILPLLCLALAVVGEMKTVARQESAGLHTSGRGSSDERAPAAATAHVQGFTKGSYVVLYRSETGPILEFVVRMSEDRR
jgi:hypothetical protein